MTIEELMLLKEITEEQFIADHLVHVYMPVTNKYDLAQTIAKICTEEDEETGLIIENSLFKRVIPIYSLVKAYTNIDTGDFDHVFDFYDLITENANTPFGKLLDDFYCIVPDAYEVLEMVEEIIESKMISNNNISSAIYRLGNKVLSKLPSEEGMKDLISETKKTFDGMNANKLKSLSNIAKVVTAKIPQEKE